MARAKAKNKPVTAAIPIADIAEDLEAELDKPHDASCQVLFRTAARTAGIYGSFTRAFDNLEEADRNNLLDTAQRLAKKYRHVRNNIIIGCGHVAPTTDEPVPPPPQHPSPYVYVPKHRKPKITNINGVGYKRK